MSLEEKINQDLKEAMKAKNTIEVETLRMVKTAFMEAKTQKNAKAIDEIAIISKMVKTRTETANTYLNAGRKDLYEQEYKEATILLKYLPQTISQADLHWIVKEVLRDLGDDAKLGEIIKVVKMCVSHRNLVVDGKVLTDTIKEIQNESNN